MTETIEELKKKIELLERFHPKIEHDDSTPEDTNPEQNIKDNNNPEYNAPQEPEQSDHKKELPEKPKPKEPDEPIVDEEEDDDGDGTEEDDNLIPVEKDNKKYYADIIPVSKKESDKLMKIAKEQEKRMREQIEEELKVKLKPPEIKTPTKTFVCEACQYPLGNRQFVPCPDCGWKMKTQLEKNQEAEKLKKEQEQIKKEQESVSKRIKTEKQDFVSLIAAGKLRKELSPKELTLGTKILVSQLESMIKPSEEISKSPTIYKVQEIKKMEHEDGYHKETLKNIF